MATSKVIYAHPLKTIATHNRSGNQLKTDAPVDNNGKGEFFSPTDLTATSLASCLLTVMGIYADKNNLDLGELSCDVTKEMESNPRRISRITVDVQWKTNLSSKDIQKLKNIAMTCPVANSLHPDIEQIINFAMVD